MMVPVQSSNIAAVGYESSSRTLAVKFKSGENYIYHDVPATIHAQFVNAGSLGQFLNSTIKQKFLTTKVSDDEIEALFKPAVQRRKVPRITDSKRRRLMSMPGTFMYF